MKTHATIDGCTLLERDRNWVVKDQRGFEHSIEAVEATTVDDTEYWPWGLTQSGLATMQTIIDRIEDVA